ncbi:MAG: hypothetical protein MHMPM18_004863 [Marteilia pararefringens]
MLRESGRNFVVSFRRSDYPLDVLHILLQIRLNIAIFYHEHMNRNMKGFNVLKKTYGLYELEIRSLVEQWDELGGDYWAQRILDTFYLVTIQIKDW